MAQHFFGIQAIEWLEILKLNSVNVQSLSEGRDDSDFHEAPRSSRSRAAVERAVACRLDILGEPDGFLRQYVNQFGALARHRVVRPRGRILRPYESTSPAP